MSVSLRTLLAAVALFAGAVAVGHEGHEHEQAPATAPSPPTSNQPSSERAVAKWSARTTADSSNPTAWVNLGNALMQQAREQPSDTLYQQAESAFRRALSLATNHAEALVGLAWVSNTRHEFGAGTRYARQAIALDPRLQDAYSLLGDAAVELGDYDLALEHYQRALDLAPNLGAYSRAAHLLWLTGDSRNAQRLMQKAIAAGGPHAENTAWCRAELGLMLFKAGALLPAEQQLERALAATPTNPHVLAGLARLEAARTNYPAAIRLYEQAVAVVPTHHTLAALTDLHSLQGDKDKADASFQRVLEFHAAHGHGHSHAPPHDDGAEPQDGHPRPEGNAELAGFLADHDRDLARALREAETAYESFKNIAVTDTLAWCYHKNGRHAEARLTIARALRWRTPDPGLLFHAGMIYAAAGDRPTAQKYLYQALSLNPRFDPVQATVAVATLEELGSRLASTPAPLETGPLNPAAASPP